LFGDFTAATGLTDAFEGACPPTFRAEYLPAGATPHCIDFILTAGGVTAESAALVFAGKELPGYVSDHIGLRARLSLSPDLPHRHGGRAQAAIEDVLVAEAVPQLALQPADRHQVLRGAWILVRRAGQRGQQAGGQVAEAGHLGERQVGRAFEPDDAGPGHARGAQQLENSASVQ